jgi:hypothetical protein
MDGQLQQPLGNPAVTPLTPVSPMQMEHQSQLNPNAIPDATATGGGVAPIMENGGQIQDGQQNIQQPIVNEPPKPNYDELLDWILNF